MKDAPGTSSIASPLTSEELFRRHGRDVARMIRRMLGPQATSADIEDLVQQVFLAAHKDLPTFRGDSAPTTWLYGIASRSVLMFLRTGRRRQRAIDAYAAEARFSSTPPDAETNLALREDLERVWKCLVKLKPEKRIVFVLYEVEQLSGKEIAAALELPEATVFTRLFHARRELLKLLAKQRDR